MTKKAKKPSPKFGLPDVAEKAQIGHQTRLKRMLKREKAIARMRGQLRRAIETNERALTEFASEIARRGEFRLPAPERVAAKDATVDRRTARGESGPSMDADRALVSA